MAGILPNERLLRVTQAKKAIVDIWKEGVLLESSSTQSVSQLVMLAATDRLKLALNHRRNANRHLSVPLYRSAVSRYYYAMYHALRACVYLSHGGDDHQGHTELPQHIPDDFAPGQDWQTKMKNARVTRNRADYDPYPKADTAFRSDALSLKADTDQLIFLARQYLRGKGCTI